MAQKLKLVVSRKWSIAAVLMVLLFAGNAGVYVARRTEAPPPMTYHTIVDIPHVANLTHTTGHDIGGVAPEKLERAAHDRDALVRVEQPVEQPTMDVEKPVEQPVAVVEKPVVKGSTERSDAPNIVDIIQALTGLIAAVTGLVAAFKSVKPQWCQQEASAS